MLLFPRKATHLLIQQGQSNSWEKKAVDLSWPSSVGTLPCLECFDAASHLGLSSASKGSSPHKGIQLPPLSPQISTFQLIAQSPQNGLRFRLEGEYNWWNSYLHCAGILSRCYYKYNNKHLLSTSRMFDTGRHVTDRRAGEFTVHVDLPLNGCCLLQSPKKQSEDHWWLSFGSGSLGLNGSKSFNHSGVCDF